jgi:hypothetical protein
MAPGDDLSILGNKKIHPVPKHHRKHLTPLPRNLQQYEKKQFAVSRQTVRKMLRKF